MIRDDKDDKITSHLPVAMPSTHLGKLKGVEGLEPGIDSVSDLQRGGVWIAIHLKGVDQVPQELHDDGCRTPVQSTGRDGGRGRAAQVSHSLHKVAEVSKGILVTKSDQNDKGGTRTLSLVPTRSADGKVVGRLTSSFLGLGQGMATCCCVSERTIRSSRQPSRKSTGNCLDDG